MTVEAPTRPVAEPAAEMPMCKICHERRVGGTPEYPHWACYLCIDAYRSAHVWARDVLERAYPDMSLRLTRILGGLVPHNWRLSGFDDPGAFILEKVRSASDAELLELRNCGEKSLRMIRTMIPYEPPRATTSHHEPPPRPVDPVVVRLQQGLVLIRQGRMGEAEDLVTKILADDPGNPDALHLLGIVCEKRADLDMAERLLERSVQLRPHSRSWQNLGVVRHHRGRLDAAIAAYRQAIAMEPDYADAWSNLLFALDMHPYATPELLLETRRAFDAAACARLTAMAAPHENDRDPDRKLRIGYVSGDFRERHSASSSFSFIPHHDRAQFELYLYSTFDSDDPTAGRFKGCADVWCEVGHLPQNELAEVIRDDQIDILVDLGGPAQGNRAWTFAMKPAPIQLSGWGYPHGLGITALDYLIGDPVATPPEHASRYPERILSLPCLMAYRPGEDVPPLADRAPQERNGYRTYGYLGRAIKLNAPTLALWAEILRADPTGRLILKSGQYGDPGIRAQVMDGLGALGVETSRIEIRGMTSRRDHLLAHNDIDVALEPQPCGSGQTTLDACLMGVPTAALAGEWASGRITASILSCLTWEAWIADDRADYVDLAINVENWDRQALRDDLLGSVIVDGPRYAQAVEAAYRKVWRRWLERV